MVIIAGEVSDISWENSSNWIFVDIGFSKNKSCGLLVGDGKCQKLNFGELKNELKKIFEGLSLLPSCHIINLVIEAPLSACFNKDGNPTGRNREKDGSKTRYWYTGPGVCVFVAASYLLKFISVIKTLKTTVMLFEGFISFKNNVNKSSHCSDVEKLRDVVKNKEKYNNAIICAEKIAISKDDTISSMLDLLGLGSGVPPIIQR